MLGPQAGDPFHLCLIGTRSLPNGSHFRGFQIEVRDNRSHTHVVVSVAIGATVAVVLVDSLETVDGLVHAVAALLSVATVVAGAISGGPGVSASPNGLGGIAHAPRAAVAAHRAVPSPAVGRIANGVVVAVAVLAEAVAAVVAVTERSIRGGACLQSLMLLMLRSGGLRIVQRQLVLVAGRLSVRSKEPHPVCWLIVLISYSACSAFACVERNLI